MSMTNRLAGIAHPLNSFRKLASAIELVLGRGDARQEARDINAQADRKAWVSASIHGCPTNNTHSQRIRDYLLANGWGLTKDPKEADLVIYSGCGVVECFEQMSLLELQHHMAQAEQVSGKKPTVVLTGCLPGISKKTEARLYGKGLEDLPGLVQCGVREMSVLDEFIGAKVPFDSMPYTTEYPREHLRTTLRSMAQSVEDPGARAKLLAFASMRQLLGFPGLRRTRKLRYAGQGLDLVYNHGFRAILPSRGCTNACSYCVIRYAKGRIISRSRADVVDQCRQLVEAGHNRLVLWPDDLASWGKDLGEHWTDLVRDIVAIGGDLELAVYNLGAHEFTAHGAFLEEMAATGNLVYLAVMLQHTNPRILKRMNRKPVDMDAFRQFWRRLGEMGIMLETHFIVGFPGETEAEFEELVRFIEDTRSTYFGLLVNPYCHRNGTIAARKYADERLDNEVIEKRAQTLQRLYTAKIAENRLDLMRIRARDHFMQKIFITMSDYMGRDRSKGF